MSRVIGILAVALLLLGVAGAVSAQTANQRLTGMTGIGYFRSNSVGPDIVGVRHWMNEGMAVDFGVGLGFDNHNDDPSSTALEDTGLLDFAFDVGLPVAIHGEENMIVYLRPGLTVGGLQGFVPNATDPAAESDKAYDIAFRGEVAVGGEFFLGQLGWPNLSFSGQIGLGVDVLSPKEEGATTSVSFNTDVRDVSITQSGSLGFHIYF
ncbi:MAG TPA: hypothetical protein VFE28_08090 [Candidatus Krumholzibacteria bacterium]|jgi:hypothetical protein|nr:hypothetical protein [Candidatus Krumholzibacteria bacterium]